MKLCIAVCATAALCACTNPSSSGADAGTAADAGTPSPGQTLWTEALSGSGAASPQAIAVDSAGNVVVAGIFSGQLTVPEATLTAAGGHDVFVAKFDPSGKHLWIRQFGGVGGDAGVRSVAFDSANNVVISGEFRATIDFGGDPLVSTGGWNGFLAKLDTSSNHLFSKSLGAGILSVAVDPSGDLVASGTFEGTVDLGGGPLTSAGGYDFLLAKFDAEGNHLWSKSFGDPNVQLGLVPAVDKDGNIFVSGLLNGTVDFGGGPLTSAGNADAVIAKVDSSGAHLWSRRFGDTNLQDVTGIAVDSAGDVVVAGYGLGEFDFGGGPLVPDGGGADVFVFKLDGAGSHLWSKRFGAASDQEAVAVAVDRQDNVVLAGYAQGSIDFGGGNLAGGDADIFVAKLNPSGGHLWSVLYPAADTQMATAIATTKSDAVVVAGYYKGTVDFGIGAVTGDGDYDGCVLKLEP